MEAAKMYEIVLLALLIGCAVSVNLTESLLQAVIIFMSYSSIMCVLWILMESPDLAITEAAVGAGVSGMLFLMTLRKLRQLDRVKTEPAEGAEELPPDEGGGETWNAADSAGDGPGTGERFAASPDGYDAGRDGG